MIKYIFVLVFFVSMAFVSERFVFVDFSDENSLIEIQEKLGKDLSDKKPNMSLKGVSAEVGKAIVLDGFSKKNNGRKSKRQSKHFVCTSCHNVEREDPDLSINDSQSRLDYVRSKGLPFLQGTALWGAVNRESYYNGDYYKKYGDLVDPARNNIREAIQLCAKECAQGRALKDWEIESILAYFWTIDIKMKDIDLSADDRKLLEIGLNDDSKKEDALRMLDTKYLKASEATFVYPPENRKQGNGLVGNVENGLAIYDSSCLHCHYKKKYSYLHLDNSKMSRKHLARNLGTYHNHSLYQVARWGVPVKAGKNSYMPQYTKEKLNEQQLADLVAYIKD